MSSFRNIAAPYWAEFIGTLVLTTVGLGATAQSLVNKDSQADALSSSVAWGLAVALGIWTSEHVSGGHINPAVTISKAIFHGFSWAQVSGYLLAQTLGAFVGAVLVWANFAAGLAALKPGEAGLHPATGAFITSNDFGQGFLGETIGSALFVLAIYAVSDANSSAKNIGPLAIGLALSAVSLGLSSPLGLALNPARDFGPRVFAALAYDFNALTDSSLYFVVPIAGPIVGGTIGAFVYEWLVKQDAEYHHQLEAGTA
ncbi:aquaporin-like protein [Linderina pennispora]|uniref:Aquaporin-like protein n=1 Tax=Linderina pennispora TaxID=61395 RepID=A0A1Y1W493_9FUNG|nr:aquaporin-like protein [Linderina pennispora]ORX67984.1 aquaporin-like protein [Linderina pennispora]